MPDRSSFMWAAHRLTHGAAVIRTCVFVLALALSGVALAGGTGADVITEEDLRNVPEWVPADEGAGVTPSVDLRYEVRDGRQVRALPEVGNQAGQNSCVGWAVAYACKSYNESQDHEWVPNHPSRIFSPSFIYNQINGGQDKGSHTQRALELVINRGCATMATMPYSDYRTQPRTNAFEEARRFRASHFSKLTTGDAIRAAIAQGHVVILVVRTDPVFNGGQYDVYTTAMRRDADARRAANVKHRYHAMCIVGFDDTRQAFLIMNSWGSNWRWHDTNYAGHAWVHYDLLRTIRPQPSYFGQAAYILHDIPAMLNDTPDVDRAVAAVGNVRYNGLRNRGHTWQWTVNLTGTHKALTSVDHVTWNVPLSNGRNGAFKRTSASDGFSLQGNHGGTGNVHITGTVTFKDNSTKTVSHRLAFNPPTQRSLTLVQTDRYWGRKGDQPYWEWSLKLNGSMTDLADVQQVTYHMHPTFPNPNRTVTDSPRNGFSYTTRGWGTFEVAATVQFKDGTTKRLTHHLKFNSPVNDTLRLTNSSRNTGTTRFGKDWFDWTAWVDGPVGVLRRIHTVRYYLHPTFNPNTFDVRGGADYGFPLSRSGWGTFEIVADVFMDDGKVYRLKHHLVFDPNNRAGNNAAPRGQLTPSRPPAFKGGKSSPLGK